MNGLAAIGGLAAAGVLSAAAVLWAFARFSDQAKIRGVRRRIKASLYEMRLFVDEPRVLLRAQKQLIAANLRYLGLMLRPVVVIAVPMFLLMAWLDSLYGYRPLHPGEPALLTVQVRPEIDLRSVRPALEVPPGVAVETPAVRIPEERRFCWRIRTAGDTTGSVRVLLDGSVSEKSLAWLSRQRVRSLGAWILSPTEARLPAGAVERIAIAYPTAGVTAFGLTLHWLTWYAIATLLATLFLKRRFGVTF